MCVYDRPRTSIKTLSLLPLRSWTVTNLRMFLAHYRSIYVTRVYISWSITSSLKQVGRFITIRSVQLSGRIRIRTPEHATTLRSTHILTVAVHTVEDAEVHSITNLADPGGRAV
jgi:hypothetical protein